MRVCGGCGSDVRPDFSFCPRCGTRLPEPCGACGFPCSPEFRFCPKCGGPLGAAPPGTNAGRPAARPQLATSAHALSAGPAGRAEPGQRSTPRPVDAAHGSRVAGSAPSAEPDADRRVVTVLFADLSGFTALSASLDPEDVRGLQTDLFREMAAAVDRYEGFVEKFVGDAVMAVFGAPVAHEDDPERALRAALAMHERVAALSREWQPRVGRPIALHVGVNTGPVVAGNLGAATDAAYAVTGDTVNTASRLQGAAGPGETVVSQATYLLAQHAFAFAPLPELEVKGKAEPLVVHRLLGALGTPGSARGLEAHGLAAPLVGRDDEMAQLLAAFDRMRGGRAQVVSIVGDAGAGKSRLVRELLAALDARGHLATTTVRQAACSSLRAQPYGVFAAFVRQAYGIAPEDTLETAHGKIETGLSGLGLGGDELGSITPVLAHVLGFDVPAPRDVDPEQLQRRIFVASRLLFDRRLEQGALLLIVEDLQWADAASVELLRVLVDRLVDRRLMLVVTYRPAFDPGAVVGARASHVGLRLGPLSPGESELILRAFFGGSLDRWPAALRELVLARAGGNPFYLEEIVRGLIGAGVLVQDEWGWRCRAEASGVDVPPTIQALLLARLDRLPAPDRKLLQEAAILAPVFDAELLRLVTSEPGRCEAGLELLVDADLLEEVAAGGESTASKRYRFSHALVQEVVYQNVLQRRRSELHGHAGRALERLCAGHPPRLDDLEALGRHFSLSAERALGARYLIAAGDQARAIYANEDALRYYRWALETLDSCDGGDRDRLVARERLGDLLGVAGDHDVARQHYDAVLAALAAAGDGPGEARLHRKIGNLHRRAGHRERALACYHEGLGRLEGQGDHIERARLYEEMGRTAFRSGDNREALAWAERALAHARTLSAALEPGAADEARWEIAASMVHASNTLGVALARMGKERDAVVHIERSAAVAEAEGLLEAACRSYANLGVLFSTFDPGRAIETCERGLAIARKTGDLALQSRLYANLAIAYCTLTNRCDEQGMTAAHAAVELDRRLGLLDHLAVPLIVLAQIHQCHGQPRLALERFQEALEIAEQTGDPQILFPCYDGLAALYLELGDDARADEYMRQAQAICERTGLDPDSLVVLPFLE